MLITYKVAPLTYVAGRLLVRVPYLGMPNVLANKEIAPEILQEAASPAALARTTETLLKEPARRKAQQEEFQKVISSLGEPGAGARAARIVADLLAG
jgi:lipid-A-disaccharide synthase